MRRGKGNSRLADRHLWAATIEAGLRNVTGRLVAVRGNRLVLVDGEDRHEVDVRDGAPFAGRVGERVSACGRPVPLAAGAYARADRWARAST